MRELNRGIRDFFLKADMFLFVTGLVCSGYGLLLISTAANVLPNGARPYLITQSAALGIGVAAFIVFSFIDVKTYIRFWKWLAGFNVAMLLLLIPFGVSRGGNKSWLSFSWLPFDIQPAEVVKISFVILMALHMYALKDKLNRPLPFLSLVAHLGVMTGLILGISRDLGVAFIYVFAFFCMLVGAGVKPRWFVALGLAVGGAAPLLWNWMGETLQMRVLYFFYPEADPTNWGWHILQSKKAFTNGGLLGTGLYNGPQTQSLRIPEQQTDFIFTAAGEELGFFAALAIILLLTAVAGRCLYVAAKAQNGYSSLICIGIAGTLIFQIYENIGMCVGLTPIIGVTLPFYSYGGSSMVSTFAALGIVSSVKMRPYPSWIRDRGIL